MPGRDSQPSGGLSLPHSQIVKLARAARLRADFAVRERHRRQAERHVRVDQQLAEIERRASSKKQRHASARTSGVTRHRAPRLWPLRSRLL